MNDLIDTREFIQKVFTLDIQEWTMIDFFGEPGKHSYWEESVFDEESVYDYEGSAHWSREHMIQMINNEINGYAEELKEKGYMVSIEGDIQVYGDVLVWGFDKRLEGVVKALDLWR